MPAIIFFAAILLISVVPNKLFAQVPAISYSTPGPYTQAVAITPLAPTSSGVAAPGYSASPLVLGLGFNNPTGVAVDAAGNVFVADRGNNAVKKIPVGGGSPVTLGSGFNTPYGVAVDAAGNVYVADFGNNAVKEIPVGGGAIITLGAGFSLPTCVAVDGAGNVFVADDGNSAVKEIPAGGGLPVIIGSGFNHPEGVTVDAIGNVFVADYTNNAVKEIPVTGGAPVTLGSGFNGPTGVAIDPAGNVFVVDYGNSMVKEIPAGGGSPISIGAGFASPFGVALDGAGNVYVADFGNGAIKEIKPTGGYYIGPILPAGLIFASATGIISGTPIARSPLTNYTVTAYNGSGSNTAVVSIVVNKPPAPTISYSSPQTYIQGTAITALSPTSTGVSFPFYSNTATVVPATNIIDPTGVATDAAGNIYVADFGAGSVKKIPVGGGPPVAIGYNFSQPYGIALDAAGNVFVGDYGLGTVNEILAANGSVVTLASGFTGPYGVAVDAAGNVYVADYNSLKKIPAAGGSAITIMPFAQLTGVAVDGSGNLYLDGYTSGYVTKIPVGGGAQVLLGHNIAGPQCVAVDGAGNVYAGYKSLVTGTPLQEIPADTTGRGIIHAGFQQDPGQIGFGFNNATGVAVDAVGNILVADRGNHLIKRIKPYGGYHINPTLPAGLSFSDHTGTISGTPLVASKATNYTITAYANYGVSKSTVVNIRVNAAPGPALAYTSPHTYTRNLAITALTPTSSGVTAPGYGSSPIAAGSGFGLPSGVATDAAGNVYVTDYVHNSVKKIPVGGGAPVAIGYSLSAPYGIALDAAGNVFEADFNTGAVKEIHAADGTEITLASGFTGPYGLALDALGNVYVADGTTLKEIPAAGGSPVDVGPAFTNILGVAIDGAGNIYVADAGNSTVKELPAGGGAPVTLGSGFNAPGGVAVDGAGNVYVGDTGNNAIKEIPAAGGSPITLGFGFNGPTALTIDPIGNLYVADRANNLVKEVKPVGGYFISTFLPAGLSFSNITGIISGTPTGTSPPTNYKVTAYNNFGVGKSAVVNIKVNAPSANANLANLSIIGAKLTPAFATGTTSYTVNVANNTSSITVKPTVSDATATVTVNGTAVPSGTASGSLPLVVGPNTVTTTVTAQDGTTTKTYTVIVTRLLPNNSYLSNLKINGGAIPLTPAFHYTTTSYTASVTNATTSIKVTPVAADVNATVKINGTPVKSGTASAPLPLKAGPNTINTIVTAQNGTSARLYAIIVTRAPSTNANLAALSLSNGTLSPAFATGTTGYTVSVNTTSITVTPTASDATATVTVNGKTVASGAASTAIPLAVGHNTITTTVTAQDGTTTNTYTITVTRLSNNANLANLKLNSGNIALSPTFNYASTSYTASVANATTMAMVTPVTSDVNAAIKVNGMAVISGTASANLPLAVGSNNIITTTVTAQDGLTTKTYTITITRATGPISEPLEAVNVQKPMETPQLEGDGVIVHQGVSPNGDGVNDFLIIDGITNYHENKLVVMNRNGLLVYEARGYDDISTVFDGHSNKTGAKQLPGTYFYSLEYKVKGVTRHKTGFIVLKY